MTWFNKDFRQPSYLLIKSRSSSVSLGQRHDGEEGILFGERLTGVRLSLEEFVFGRSSLEFLDTSSAVLH